MTNAFFTSTFALAQPAGAGASGSEGAPAAGVEGASDTGASGGGAPSACGSMSSPTSIIMMVVMFAVFYFLLIRPQQKKAKERQKMLDAIQKGVEVVTNGGLIGRVMGISDKTLTIEISEKVRVRVLRSQVGGLYSADNVESK